MPAGGPALPNLYFYHDPMCSWCWGYRPVSDKLFASLPDGVRRIDIVGGLAADDEQPMPADMQAYVSQTWRRIESMLGTEFNHQYWTECAPRRSTYPACRAVLAAAEQNAYDPMVNAIQRAYYLRAMNPSDTATLEKLAAELDLDGNKFSADLRSQAINEELLSQTRFAASSPIRGFPALALELDGSLYPVRHDYKSPLPTLEHLRALLSNPIGRPTSG